MNRKTIYIFINFSLLIISHFALSYYKYTGFLESLALEKERGNLVGNLLYYYEQTGQFPKKYFKADSLLHKLRNGEEKQPLEVIEERFYIDKSSNKRRYYTYIPVYNKLEKRQGFLLLAAGIDGKIDNKMTKIYRGNFGQVRKYDNNSFSYFNLWFGNKDIVIYQKLFEK